MVAVEGSKISTPKKGKLKKKVSIAHRILNGLKVLAGDVQNQRSVPLVLCSDRAIENNRGPGFPHVFPQPCGKALKT